MRQTGGGSTKSGCCSWSKSLSEIPESLQYLQRRRSQRLSRCSPSVWRDSKTRTLSQDVAFLKGPPGFRCSRRYLRSRPADLQAIALRTDGCFATSTWYSHGALSWDTVLVFKVRFPSKGKVERNTFISLPKQGSPLNSKRSHVVSGIWKIFGHTSWLSFKNI